MFQTYQNIGPFLHSLYIHIGWESEWYNVIDTREGQEIEE